MSTVITHHHAHHFYDREQEASSAKLGMWLFLVTEVLLFSGLFVGYTVIKTLNPEMWKVASEQLDWVLGSINTLVLITSSWTVAVRRRARCSPGPSRPASRAASYCTVTAVSSNADLMLCAAAPKPVSTARRSQLMLGPRMQWPLPCPCAKP